MTKGIPTIIKYRALAIAKGMSPYDTGNLRHNAIKLKKVKSNSFTINYDADKANYIERVEEGNFRSSHFIYNTYIQLARELKNYYNYGGKGFKTNSKNFNRLSQANLQKSLATSQDNPARKWVAMQQRLKADGVNFNWR